VDMSQNMLLMLTSEYFTSVNCLGELLRGVLLGVPLIGVVEVDEGEATRNSLEQQIDSAIALVHASPLGHQIQNWELGPIPTAQQVRQCMFAQPLVEWTTIGYMQAETLRLITNRLLRVRDEDDTTFEKDREPRRLLPLPREGHAYHLFVSRHNNGADQFIEELRTFLEPNETLLTTSDPQEMLKAEAVLIYLNGLTWTGRASTSLGIDAKAALDAERRLMLVHEMPGGGVGDDSDLHGVPFDSFFKHTPPDLLEMGLYQEIALSLKAGPLRRVCLERALQTVLKPPTPLASMLQRCQSRASTISRVSLVSAISSCPSRRASHEAEPPKKGLGRLRRASVAINGGSFLKVISSRTSLQGALKEGRSSGSLTSSKCKSDTECSTRDRRSDTGSQKHIIRRASQLKESQRSDHMAEASSSAGSSGGGIAQLSQM